LMVKVKIPLRAPNWGIISIVSLYRRALI